MAYDSDQALFHLTSEGWVVKSDEPFPPDRVETWSYDMYQASGWSKEIITLKRVWTNEAVDETRRREIREKYGFAYSSNRRRDVTIKY